MFLADQQAGIPSGMLVIDQNDEGVGVRAAAVGGLGGGGRQTPLQPVFLQDTTEGEWL